MQNHVNTHPPTPKKTREVAGIAVGPKDVQSLYPGVALCPTPDSGIVFKNCC